MQTSISFNGNDNLQTLLQCLTNTTEGSQQLWKGWVKICTNSSYGTVKLLSAQLKEVQYYCTSKNLK